MDKLKALFEQAGIPTDFAPKASVLFEASVNEAVETRVRAEVKKIQEAAEDNLEKAKDEWIKESEDDVDAFLDKTIKEWAAKNEAAIAGSIKAGLAESIMTKLKAVLESEGVSMPDEKETSIKEAEEEIEKLKEEVEDKEEELKEAKRQIVKFIKADIISEATKGLSRVTADRIASLSESTSFKNSKQYARAVATLTEALTGKKLKLKEDLADDNKDGDKDGGANDPDASGGNKNKPAIPARPVKEGTGGAEKFPADASTDPDAVGVNKDKVARVKTDEGKKKLKEGDNPFDKDEDEEDLKEGKSKYFAEAENDEDKQDFVKEGKKRKLKEDDSDVEVKDNEDGKDDLKESFDIVGMTLKSYLRG